MPDPTAPVPLLVGTAQLTRRYGVAAGDEVLDEAGGVALVREAAAAEVAGFDTAPVYGAAERVLGLAGVAAPVWTKVDPAGDVAASIARSAARLQRSRLDGVLFHDASVVLGAHPGAVDAARSLVGTVVDRLGVSVYTTEELEAALTLPWVEVVQVPVSVADRRLVAAELLERAASSGRVVFARSAYLQGALLLPPDRLPAHLADLVPTVRAIRAVADEAGRSLPELLTVFVRDLPGTTAVVLGVESPAQLAEAVAAASAPPLAPEVTAALLALPAVAEHLVDPRRWP